MKKDVLAEIEKTRSDFPEHPSGYEVICDAVLEMAYEEIFELRTIVKSRKFSDFELELLARIANAAYDADITDWETLRSLFVGFGVKLK